MMPYTMIRFNESNLYWIQVEFVDMLKNKSLRDSVLNWIMSFWAFNYEISEKLKFFVNNFN